MNDGLLPLVAAPECLRQRVLTLGQRRSLCCLQPINVWLWLSASITGRSRLFVFFGAYRMVLTIENTVDYLFSKGDLW